MRKKARISSTAARVGSPCLSIRCSVTTLCGLIGVPGSALESGSLHAGAVDGPLLRRGALPYAIPVDQG